MPHDPAMVGLLVLSVLVVLVLGAHVLAVAGEMCYEQQRRMEIQAILWRAPKKDRIPKEGQGDDECAVCLDDLQTTPCVTLPCGHTFHRACAQRWFFFRAFRTRRCPICRHRTLHVDRALHREMLSDARAMV